MLSVVSVAAKVSKPVLADFTVKVATPEALVVPETVVIVGAPGPEVWARVTVLPETGLLFASFKVTVIVEVVVPSAATEAGDGETVDTLAETAPAVMVSTCV